MFNLDQVEGDHLDHLRAGHGEDDTDGAIIDFQPAEEAIEATGITIRHGGGQGFYSPGRGFRPGAAEGAVHEPDEYYATVLHELAHATEHPSRLDWCRKETETPTPLGNCVAEIGACYLARELGVPAQRT